MTKENFKMFTPEELMGLGTKAVTDKNREEVYLVSAPEGKKMQEIIPDVFISDDNTIIIVKYEGYELLYRVDGSGILSEPDITNASASGTHNLFTREIFRKLKRKAEMGFKARNNN